MRRRFLLRHDDAPLNLTEQGTLLLAFFVYVATCVDLLLCANRIIIDHLLTQNYHHLKFSIEVTGRKDVLFPSLVFRSLIILRKSLISSAPMITPRAWSSAMMSGRKGSFNIFLKSTRPPINAVWVMVSRVSNLWVVGRGVLACCLYVARNVSVRCFL